MLICLDAGHAKSTAGKRSFDESFREYEFNRDVTKRLRKHLERHGLKVMYSCDLDLENDTPLTKRCEAANKAGADLFVSDHANAFGTTWNDANGTETFYSEGSEKGYKLACCIQKQLINDLGLKDRGVKIGDKLGDNKEDFTVLENTNMPAVLIEYGFYTNKVEVAKLKDSNFREKCAVATAKGILDYLGIEWKGKDEEMSKDEIKKLINEVIDERLFNQKKDVSEWAKEPWEDAKEKGIVDGTSPKAVATREQVVSMIHRALSKEK